MVDLTAQKMVDGKESQSDDMMVVSKDKYWVEQTARYSVVQWAQMKVLL